MHMKSIPYKLFFIFYSTFLISCHDDHDKGTQPMMDNTIHKQLQQIQDKKIFFGHQSVGNDIIRGMKDILANYDDIHFNFISVNTSNQLPENY